MLKWAQGAVAAVTGSAEPEYGAEAFHSIEKVVDGRNPYGELSINDLEWKEPAQSHVETQVFYFTTPSGYYGFVQLIHSNPVNVAYTSQCTFLLKKHDDKEFKIWTSTRLENHQPKKLDFEADNFAIHYDVVENSYTFKASVNPESIIDLKFTRVADGFKIGPDGTSRYGTDPENPWGTMRHVFWPRTTVSGTVKTEKDTISLDNGTGMFVMALQGMKPHHAAARWNFLNFQGPTLSIIAMDFETPASYGPSRVSVGGIVKDNKLIATCTGVKIEHQDAVEDDVGWAAPHAIKFSLEGPDPSAKSPEPTVKATVQGKLETLVDRVDVMAEIPAFVKRLAAGVSGARPYIYQYMNELTAEVEIDGKTFTEKGEGFNEATFIS